MKFSTLPPFKAIGKVAIYEGNTSNLLLNVEVGCYTTDRDSIYSSMLRQAKWAVQRLGLTEDAIKALDFEYNGTFELYALEPRGVKRTYGDRVEAFFDEGPTNMRKRDTLIRQRRLVPDEHKDAIAIYGKKPAPAKQEAAVAA